ncbi:MAG: guanylate kinase [Proteobacteria bacterium]|nr:guanylate kinase [Pseudomonadota bacterium]
MNDLLLLIISSPSGAGKTTLTRNLLDHFPELGFSVSYTTRKPRSHEVDGQDYRFVDPGEFQRMIDGNEFAEWAQVHGYLYGTSLAEIARCSGAGKRGIVFDIDYQGARQIRAARPDAVSVFVLPPSMPELKRRLRDRASDDAATIERRFRNAAREVEYYGLFDYLVVNDDLEAAKQTLRSIVTAEQARRWRMAARAERLLQTAS